MATVIKVKYFCSKNPLQNSLTAIVIPREIYRKGLHQDKNSWSAKGLKILIICLRNFLWNFEFLYNSKTVYLKYKTKFKLKNAFMYDNYSTR